MESLRVSERSEGSCFGISAELPLFSSGCSFKKSSLALTIVLYVSRICRIYPMHEICRPLLGRM